MGGRWGWSFDLVLHIDRDAGRGGVAGDAADTWGRPTGRPVSLLDTFMTSSTLQLGGYPKPDAQRWHVGEFFDGAHLSELDEPVKQLIVELSSLLEWSGTSPLAIHDTERATTIEAAREVRGPNDRWPRHRDVHRLPDDGRSVCVVDPSPWGLRTSVAPDRRLAIRGAEVSFVNPLRAMVAFLTLGSADFSRCTHACSIGPNNRDRSGQHTRQMVASADGERDPRRVDMICTRPIPDITLRSGSTVGSPYTSASAS